MTRMKRLLSIILMLALMTTSFSVISYASDDGNTNQVLPRAALCANCEIGEMIWTAVSYSPWNTIGRTPCTHDIEEQFWSWDEIQERIVTFNYVCNHCGASTRLNTTTEERIVHHDG